MDVVRRNLQALRGTIQVESQAGRGTRLTLRLPLTLAIIDGFLVQSANRSYVIPLDSVVECVERPTTDQQRSYFNLRGKVLPALRLRERFGLPGERPERESVVVVQYAGQRAGIVVDRLAGELQAGIKPRGAIFRHLQGIGGSTILGSGEVALILDIPALIKIAGQAEERLLARPELLGA
jgi:two-component system chemotaxis sensor kinase CheA